jgi:hypothetical protein
MQIEMTAEEVGPFVNSLPAGAAEPGSGIVYHPVEHDENAETGALIMTAPSYLDIPPQYEDAAAALLVIGLPAIVFNAAKADRQAAVNSLRDEAIADGYRHDFDGTAGIRTLDQRSEADAINWLGLSAIADKMVATGSGSSMLGLRDMNNSTFEASATVVAAAMAAMGQWRNAIMARSWELKDEIATAEDQAALDAIDIEADWPG